MLVLRAAHSTPSTAGADEDTCTVLLKSEVQLRDEGKVDCSRRVRILTTKGGVRACVRATVKVPCELLGRVDSIDRRSHTSDHCAAFRRTKSGDGANSNQRAILRWITARFVASFMEGGAFGSQPWRGMHSEAGSGE